MTFHMMIFDIAVAGFVLFVGLKGIFNGAWKEMFGLAGLMVGLLLASRWARDVGERVMNLIYPIDSASGESLVGFVILVFSSWLIFLMVGVYIFHSKEMRIRGWADRAAGFLFASFKIFLIVAVTVYALFRIEFIEKNMHRYVDGSVLYPVLTKIGAFVLENPKNRSLEKIPSGHWKKEGNVSGKKGSDVVR